MAIPDVNRTQILEAIARFDSSLRNSDKWARWQDNRAQQWALEANGSLYPPKEIISMATGAPVSSFSGGPQSNDYLNARGFSVRRLRDASLSAILATISAKYPEARANTTFAGTHEISELFAQARQQLQAFVESMGFANIAAVSSYGKGNWAAVPWISLLDRRETTTTQRGTYVVYLFAADGRGVYLKLAQGVTKPRQELGARAVDVLRERADAVRSQCPDLVAHGFDVSGVTDLGASQDLAKLYEASTVAAKFYAQGSIPSDKELLADLEVLLRSYSSYVDRELSLGRSTPPDDRKLALVGTWRGALQQLPEIEQALAKDGAVASWWSFVVKEEAVPRLTPPFFLYAYDGTLVFRARVDAVQTSRGSAGIPSPWPEITLPQFRGVTRESDKQSGVFKTWLRLGAVQRLTPAKALSDFEIATGLSTPENVLNQNSFGYVIDEAIDEAAPPSPPAQLVRTQPAAFDFSWLVNATGLEEEFLREIVSSLLGNSPQIVLAGPPGTSKTWLARQLARFVTRDQTAHARFVQFHPTYSYESFVEGLRPVSREGSVGFARTPGIVVELVEFMRQELLADRDDCEFVVVMDEMNRANLARVFGELLYLFEYRQEALRLQYSGEFSLPKNLRFIGTMNTADRSIRSIDAAMRRRLEIFELRPDLKTLERYYEMRGSLYVSDLLSGFEALNHELESQLDRHHTVGHALFMQPRLDPPALRRVWRRKIYPLIEEYFFDQPELAKEFRLERFWPSFADA